MTDRSSRIAGVSCSWWPSGSGTSSGAGVFGFLINLPVVSYYEIGTQLTANHGHAAMMGVYGMLAVSLLVFCLRYYLREEDWSERLLSVSFWALNLGLAWMVFANLFPIGVLQLADVVTNGYWHARSLEFLKDHAYSNGCASPAMPPSLRERCPWST